MGRERLQRDPTAMASDLPPQPHLRFRLGLTSLSSFLPFSFYFFFETDQLNISFLTPTCVF